MENIFGTQIFCPKYSGVRSRNTLENGNWARTWELTRKEILIDHQETIFKSFPFILMQIQK